MIVAIPLGYWLIGPVIVWTYLLGVLGVSWIVPYPLKELFVGVGYSVYGDEKLLYIVLMLGLAVVALPYVGRRFSSGSKIIEWGGVVAIVLFGLLLIPQGYRADDYEEIEYDEMLRKGLWRKRLAETALITGEDEVARKYISILDETLYYSKWAREARQYLGHPERLEAHPIYGRLRFSYDIEEVKSL